MMSNDRGKNLTIQQTTVAAQGFRFAIYIQQTEVARAFLYLMHNDLHEDPFGLLEDVFVDEKVRGKGLGRRLLDAVIKCARDQGCYKLIATSRYARPRVHDLYMCLGFKDYGKEFRLDFQNTET